MRVQYIKSACVLVEHGGKRVLCDPWLTDGTYYGSWYHYPPLKFTPEDFANVDYIYLSHIHPDHMDPETLKRLPRSIPILILDYADKFVLRILQSLGFADVREIPHGRIVELGPDFRIELLSADDCDPVACGKFFACAVPQPYTKTLQIDSMAVFEGGGKTVVNTNDCPFTIAAAAARRARVKYGTPDLLLVGYGGAGPYPQCFENLSAEEKRAKAEAKRRQFLSQAVDFIDILRPAHYLPFAGQYTLGGRLAVLNEFRGVPEVDEVPEALAPLLAERGLDSKAILLNQGEWFDVDSGRPSKPYAAPDPAERRRYIKEVLAAKKLDYELASGTGGDLRPLLERALERMKRHRERLSYRSDWTVYLDVGGEELYAVPFDDRPLALTPRRAERPPYVRIGLDRALLGRILDRKAHWNNAEIGSHLRIWREPDEFERGVFNLLSYLHA